MMEAIVELIVSIEIMVVWLLAFRYPLNKTNVLTVVIIQSIAYIPMIVEESRTHTGLLDAVGGALFAFFITMFLSVIVGEFFYAGILRDKEHNLHVLKSIAYTWVGNATWVLIFMLGAL
ncbi:MAG: hypothetical protein IKX10_02200 [Lachnospiraceae bacterium]|nr:hypothetical protein [Lachnospiraceae bacterium]